MYYNPGEQLQLLLKELFPQDLLDKKSFVARIDSVLVAEDSFSELVYNSCINYMVRRLITTAEYIKRNCHKNGFPEPERKILSGLRKFILDETRIPTKQTEKVLVLLRECIHERNKKPSLKTKDYIRKKAQERNETRCYMCGCETDFVQTGQHDSAEVEHLWPLAMGGSNEPPNLRVACSRCNNEKADYIDASDYHYEEISLVTDIDDESFNSDLKGIYRIAIWAKSKFRCIVCDRLALYVGELKFGRINPHDSWHFLNIDAYCDKHTPKQI